MNFPSDFKSSIQPLLGDETDTFLSVLAGVSPVSFRMNPFKADRNPMDLVLPYEHVPWSQWGFYLKERPAFTFDPLFHSGYYYVQEASSMFVEYLAQQLVTDPVVCLDLCAAPGGKSVSLLSVLPEGSLLISNELVRQRAHILSETMTKFGHPNIMVTNNMTEDFSAFPHLFDLILVDAPCSGEGMFRKEETAVKEWSLRNVEMCAARQKDILGGIWSALKPGGMLIYSTCTYNTAEDEENSLWIADELGAEFIPVEVDESWGISSSFDKRVNGYRFFPHKTQGEGFYVTVLKKKGTESTVKQSARKKNPQRSLPFLKDRAVYSNLLLHLDTFDLVESANHIIALPTDYSGMILSLNERLKTVSMGIEIGERKGKDFIPSHTLAMSKELNTKAFLQYEVTLEKAVSYLRREAIMLADAPGGYLLLTYKAEPLGFVKNLCNRANNLYPNEWRIRSGYLPDKPTEIFHPHTPYSPSSNP